MQCPRCNSETVTDASFCHKCGRNLAYTSRSNLFLAGTLIPLVIIAVLMSNYLSGKRPTQAFQKAGDGQQGKIDLDSPRAGTKSGNNSNPHDTNDSKLLLLRKEVSDNPKDLAKLKEYSDYLISKIKDANGLVSQGLVLEVVDALSGVVQQEPGNADALGALADLSFDQKVFSKSAEYYKRYLEIRPEDLSVKSRLASSLVFLRQTDEAITILNSVLAKDPNNFHAHAYLSVALSEKGDLEGAKKEAAIAVDNAPSEEAKNRITAFVAKMSEQAAGDNQPPPPDNSAPLSSVEKYLTTNEITASKYVKGEQDQQILKLYFKDFPMQAMPPFAKDKFIGKIKEALSGSGIQAVKLIDIANGSVMQEVLLAETK